jgi:hypothetical protein
MVGVHSVSGHLDAGILVRMVSSTTMAPGIGGELGVGAHPQVTPISTHVDIYSYRINRQTNNG